MGCSSCGGNKTQMKTTAPSKSAARQSYSPSKQSGSRIIGTSGYGSPKVKLSFGSRGR